MSSQGIQTLLEAEKEATKVVAKARQYRIQKLKDAKSEAVKEINALKAQKEKEYEQTVKGLQSTTETDQVTKETEERLVALKASFAKNKEAVIKKLLDTVCRVEPQIHKNLK